MSTKLFVGNPSHAITEQELRDAFAQGGRTVQSVRIARDRETNRPRGFAFVEVATEADADAAINEWNNKLLAGRPVFVEKPKSVLLVSDRLLVPSTGPRRGSGRRRWWLQLGRWWQPGGGYNSDGSSRPMGPRPPMRSFGGPAFDPGPQRESGRRHNTKPDRKGTERKPLVVQLLRSASGQVALGRQRRLLVAFVSVPGVAVSQSLLKLLGKQRKQVLGLMSRNVR